MWIGRWSIRLRSSPVGGGGKFKASNGAAAAAGGIAAAHRIEDAAAGLRGVDRLAGALQTFFRRRGENSEVGAFRWSGSGVQAPLRESNPTCSARGRAGDPNPPRKRACGAATRHRPSPPARRGRRQLRAGGRRQSRATELHGIGAIRARSDPRWAYRHTLSRAALGNRGCGSMAVDWPRRRKSGARRNPVKPRLENLGICWLSQWSSL